MRARGIVAILIGLLAVSLAQGSSPNALDLYFHGEPKAAWKAVNTELRGKTLSPMILEQRLRLARTIVARNLMIDPSSYGDLLKAAARVQPAGQKIRPELSSMVDAASELDRLESMDAAAMSKYLDSVAPDQVARLQIVAIVLNRKMLRNPGEPRWRELLDRTRSALPGGER